FQIFNCASHGTDHTNQSERADRTREMPGRWNASRSGFKSADSAEVGRHSNGAAAIAANASRRTAGSNRGGFTAAGTTGRVREFPGIICAAVKKIVRLPRH